MIEGNKVKLTPIKREYIETFLKWFNDPEITQYLIVYRPLTQIEEEEWFENKVKNQNSIIFSILYRKEDGSELLIGNCGLEIDWKNRLGQFGIVIGESEFHSRGFGTEASKLLVDYGFNTLNLHRIELDVFEFNKRAIKAYKKVGFIEEGRKRKSHFENGAYHDRIMMSILREEWKLDKEK
jgi:RimJ/RimL family protein N-acetyltransferase